MPADSLHPFPVETHETDVCVVGGGMAGVCAALSAARHGARVVLMQDRPVLGGNASSECRMHICGADRAGRIPHMRETGILEELRLENLYHNPHRSFALWDLVLYDAVVREPRITLLLNCSCLAAEMNGDCIRTVEGWQLTSQTRHSVSAPLFIDCSGDSILAPLTGADFSIGREASATYGESIAPAQADRRTMGMTCMFQAREMDAPVSFVPPAWAYRFESCDELPYGARGHGYWEMGYWWIELGGEADSIRDTESTREELLRITLGVWDHIKNSGHHDAARWSLEWIQFLPAKRESRRYLGDHVLTQGDIETGGRFADTVAYGGWPMDDHDTAGFRAVTTGRPATIFHPAPSPYGIPYRVLYSRNIRNLMFAGRNVSCSHVAMSSTRVMATCAILGQAVGTAAALACRERLRPRDLLPRIHELQQILLEDDCYLPGVARVIPDLSQAARLTAAAGNPEPVRDAIARQVGEDAHAWSCPVGHWIAYDFTAPRRVNEVRLVLDSGMDQVVAHLFTAGYKPPAGLPGVMPRAFRIEVKQSGRWSSLHTCKENRQRLVRIPAGIECEGVRLTLDATWGAPASRIYEFTVR